MEVADLTDMIESERRVVRRMRWFNLPVGGAGILFFASVLAMEAGEPVPVTILLVMFAALLARNVQRYRRRLRRLAELEEQLDELDGEPRR